MLRTSFVAMSYQNSSIVYKYFNREIRQGIALRRTLYGTRIYAGWNKSSSVMQDRFNSVWLHYPYSNPNINTTDDWVYI